MYSACAVVKMISDTCNKVDYDGSPIDSPARQTEREKAIDEMLI